MPTMVGSGAALDPAVSGGFGFMAHIDMEQGLENIDRRLSSVEQVLPTLATRIDLERFATKADLERFATKADLEGFATKADLERFATKVDLEGFGWLVDLRQGIAEAKRHTDVLIESVRDDIRMLAEGVVAVAANLRSLTERLEEKGVI
jgi:hypothetical protein